MKKLTNQELNRASIEDFAQLTKNPLVLVLDNVRSLHNVGATFRTADAFLIEKIYLCGITGTPPHREIEKTALGATQTVEWQHTATTLEAIESLESQGYTIVSVEQVEQSIPLNQFIPEKDKKYAFVFGNEVTGVEENIVGKSAFCVEIPQFGTKHSLNISVTVGIVCWDFICKL
jgi:23S rRNA (guanosine2251-2'-O)-methyltransferase